MVFLDSLELLERGELKDEAAFDSGDVEEDAEEVSNQVNLPEKRVYLKRFFQTTFRMDSYLNELKVSNGCLILIIYLTLQYK